MATRAERRRVEFRQRQKLNVSLTRTSLTSRLDAALEWTWLVAVFLVPVIIFPDSEFISRVGIAKTATLRLLASLTLILLIASATLRVIATPVALNISWNFSFGRKRLHALAAVLKANMLPCAVGLLVASTLLSTATSVLPAASIWGKEPGNESYSLHTLIPFWVIWLAIVIRLRAPVQFWRLLAAIAAAGLLMSVGGIAQSLGMWPVHESYYLGRATANLGNPISLGAFLLLAFPIAMGLLLIHLRPRVDQRTWLAVSAIVAFLFLYSIELTLSRGPYIGMGVVIVAFILLLWRFQGRKVAFELGLPVLVAIALVTLLILGQSESAAGVEQTAELPTLEGRLATRSTINSRLDIWRASWALLTERPPVPGEGNLPALTRHIVGYGPETYRYTLPLTAAPRMLDQLTSEAHNDFLHRVTELGLLGLAATMFLLYAVFRTLWSNMTAGKRTQLIAGSAIAAAVLGRTAEQITGVARTTDTLVFWVLIAAVFVLPHVFGTVRKSDEDSSSDPAPEPNLGPVRNAVIPGIAVTLAFAIVMLTLFVAWQKTVLYAAADNNAATANRKIGTDPDSALELYDLAIARAPDVNHYYELKSKLLLAIADNTADKSQKYRLQQAAYESDRSARDNNPLDRNANFRLGASAWNLAVAGVPGKAEETVAIYEHLDKLAPRHTLVQPRLAQLYSATGLQPSE